jgi:hypothetical protein
MGTEYELYENNDTIRKIKKTLCIGEMSNELELYVYTYENDNDEPKLCNITKDLKPEEMMKIFLEGITVCSYWMSKKEFYKTILDNFKEYSC